MSRMQVSPQEYKQRQDQLRKQILETDIPQGALARHINLTPERFTNKINGMLDFEASEYFRLKAAFQFFQSAKRMSRNKQK